MKKIRTVITAAIIAAGAVFIIAGMLNGGAEAVYMRSSMVCLECIGIG